MAEYTCITRKIEVSLHNKEDYPIWNAINNNLYKAANRIVSHRFLNDTYKLRLKLDSPRYIDLDKELRTKKVSMLSDELLEELREERHAIVENCEKIAKLSLELPSEQNSTDRIARHEFRSVIPTEVLTTLNDNIYKTYRKFESDIYTGERSIPTYKKGLPVPFPIKKDGLKLRKREDGSIYVRFPKGLEWDLKLDKDPSGGEIVERVLSGQYDVGNSSIQETKRNKHLLLLVVKIPKEQKQLNPDRVVGVDLGINTPVYAALNDTEYRGLRISSRDQFLKVRERIAAQRRELQLALSHSTHGGHGRGQKLQALERFKRKEHNWVDLQYHIFSKTVIEYALKNNAGVIQMEDLTGIGRDRQGEVKEKSKFILRNWSFANLQKKIEYKANAAGIEVRYITPALTSQTCSFCGHYEEGQRPNQPTFLCKNPNCTKGKGKQLQDGSFTGINADWNAARNIALSTEIVDRKKK